jgi:exopolysaccharide biosynthesis polyprenyl glycosylphosphotransferase
VKLAPHLGVPKLPRVVHACWLLVVMVASLFGVKALSGVSWFVAFAILVAALALPATVDLALSPFARGRRRRPRKRIAIIGDAGVAKRLRNDLERGPNRYVFVGWIAMPGDLSPTTMQPLAGLRALREVLVEHDIQLLILSPSASRDKVFDELVGTCLDLPVQVVELSYFYEAEFGYVPISEMKAVWFQYLLDPSSRFPHPLAKRAIDLLGTLLVGLPALPLCAVLVLLVRRDGGPGIFRQTRIGEGGRLFVLYKLRTMRPSSGTSAAQWASADDPRVTGIGRFMRRTHLDELPQLLNVLRGEMSLVGPRPEQPAFVERLEREVPFYQRRHLIRPGISGWAQVRCGYARSDAGSVWKHCHDLFYLKHRSIGLDFWILAKTASLILRGGIRETDYLTSPVAPIETLTPQKAAVADGPQVMVGGNRPA